MREIMLILHFIGLAMGLGTSFAHAFLATATVKMSAEEATKFRLHSLVLSKMGHIGMALLIVSGIYLIIPFWEVLPSYPLLIVKLILVVILNIFIALISTAARKAREGDAERQFNKIKQLGKITLLTSLAIVILAVTVFH